jgi:Ser/Thr protein kinase RdoA (MazF antagonist)
LIAARENRVYRVDMPGGPIAMRLHRIGLRSAKEIASELQWMAMLSDAGLNVPCPVVAPNGSSIAQFGETIVDVVSWLDGVPLSGVTPTTDHFARLGIAMARMHSLADRWTPPDAFTRPKWDANGLVGDTPLWGRFWENPTLTSDQAAQLCAFRDYALEILDETGDFGLIHADMVPENILTSDDTLYTIDFDDGGFGYRLFDIATVTNRCRRIAPNGSLETAFLDSYAKYRPLDHTALPLFEALRACTYLGWIVPRLSEDGASKRNARFTREAMDRINALGRLRSTL